MDLQPHLEAYKAEIEFGLNEAKNDIGHNSFFLVALNNVLYEYDSILNDLEIEEGMYSTILNSSLPGDFPNPSTAVRLVSFEAEGLSEDDIKLKFKTILEGVLKI